MRAGRRLIFALISLALGILTFVLSNPLPPVHQGYERLHWAALKGFTERPNENALPSQAAYPEGIISWDTAGASNSKRRAESEPFILRGPLVELEVSGLLALSDSLRPTVALVATDGKVLADFALPLPGAPFAAADWSSERFAIDASYVGKEAKFIFRSQPNPAPGAWFALRERVDFYSLPRFQESPISFPSRGFYLLALFFLLSSVCFLFSLDLKSLGHLSIFSLFLLGTAFVQLRTTSYFYWDEWHVLERFKNLGVPGVVYTHNEHFLPLFFSWLFLEAKIFANHYLAFILVSAALHALNGVLLCSLLTRLGSTYRFVKEASFLLSSLFVLNSLQAETLQWAFEQSILLFQLCTFIAFLSAHSFLESGNKRALGVAVMSALFAPLFFGNGFSLPLQLAVVLGILQILPSYFRSRALGRQMGKRFLFLLGLMAVGAIVAALLYKAFKENSGGHGVDRVHPLGHLAEVAEYLWVGTQYGSILRGFALFPALGPESTLEALALIGIKSLHPFMLLANAGFVFSLLLLFLGARGESSKWEVFRYWLAGQLLLFACFILPSLGRFENGAGQSLSLRYHYSTLVAVSIIALPAASFLFGCAFERKFRRSLGAMFFLILAVHFCVSKNFDYFTRQGFEHRLFVEQLTSWRSQLKTLPEGTSYEATGTSLSGMHPANRPTITPGRHPNDLYEVLHWLNPTTYPK